MIRTEWHGDSRLIIHFGSNPDDIWDQLEKGLSWLAAQDSSTEVVLNLRHCESLPTDTIWQIRQRIQQTIFRRNRYVVVSENAIVRKMVNLLKEQAILPTVQLVHTLPEAHELLDQSAYA